jgi:hypothetical protein
VFNVGSAYGNPINNDESIKEGRNPGIKGIQSVGSILKSNRSFRVPSDSIK